MYKLLREIQKRLNAREREERMEMQMRPRFLGVGVLQEFCRGDFFVKTTCRKTARRDGRASARVGRQVGENAVPQGETRRTSSHLPAIYFQRRRWHDG